MITTGCQHKFVRLYFLIRKRNSDVATYKIIKQIFKNLYHTSISTLNDRIKCQSQINVSYLIQTPICCWDCIQRPSLINTPSLTDTLSHENCSKILRNGQTEQNHGWSIYLCYRLIDNGLSLCLQFQVQWKDSALWTTDGLNFCWDHTEKVLLSLFKLRE